MEKKLDLKRFSYVLSDEAVLQEETDRLLKQLADAKSLQSDPRYFKEAEGANKTITLNRIKHFLGLMRIRTGNVSPIRNEEWYEACKMLEEACDKLALAIQGLESIVAVRKQEISEIRDATFEEVYIEMYLRAKQALTKIKDEQNETS